MTMQRKTFEAFELKSGRDGAFRARFATLTDHYGQPVVDLDGEFYSGPDAFPSGKTVPISTWGHGSWEAGGANLPVGLGIIRADVRSAWIDGHFFLDSTAGRDTHAVVKELWSSGAGCEWSFGFDPMVFTTGPHAPPMGPGAAGYGAQPPTTWPPGAKRALLSLNIFEVSPVLRGAGIGTRTESIKSVGAAADYELMAIRDRVWLEVKREELADRQLLFQTANVLREAQQALFPHGWKEVSAGSVAVIAKKLAREVVLRASVECATASPRIRWFTAAGAGDVSDFKTEVPCWGYVNNDEDIWIRSDLRAGDLAETVAHETFHIKQRRQGVADLDLEAKPSYYGQQVRLRFERSN